MLGMIMDNDCRMAGMFIGILLGGIYNQGFDFSMWILLFLLVVGFYTALRNNRVLATLRFMFGALCNLGVIIVVCALLHLLSYLWVISAVIFLLIFYKEDFSISII